MKKIKPHGPLPSQTQLAYLGDELAAFIHFGPNTFYDQEWGTTCHRGMPIVPSIMWTEKRTTMPIIWLS